MHSDRRGAGSSRLPMKIISIIEVTVGNWDMPARQLPLHL